MVSPVGSYGSPLTFLMRVVGVVGGVEGCEGLALEFFLPVGDTWLRRTGECWV